MDDVDPPNDMINGFEIGEIEEADDGKRKLEERDLVPVDGKETTAERAEDEGPKGLADDARFSAENDGKDMVEGTDEGPKKGAALKETLDKVANDEDLKD